MFQTQLDNLVDLARAFPQTTIVLNPYGSPLAIGPYAGKREDAFTEWRDRIRKIAAFRNTYVKLGELGMKMIGCTFFESPNPPSSQDLEKAWRPLYRELHRGLRPATLDVRKQFPRRQGHLELSGPVECVQAHCRRLFRRRKGGPCSAALQRKLTSGHCTREPIASMAVSLRCR